MRTYIIAMGQPDDRTYFVQAEFGYPNRWTGCYRSASRFSSMADAELVIDGEDLSAGFFGSAIILEEGIVLDELDALIQEMKLA